MTKLLQRGILLAGFVAVGAAALAQAETYRLGENDELRIIAPGSPGIAGTYRLGEQGRIALPIRGSVKLGGLTLDEATEKMRVALEADIVAPVLGVELVARRPFYITGDVAQPGAYPGTGGLTLEQAVALAGGNRRNAESERLQFATSDIRAREELDRSLRERASAEALLARLEAELRGTADYAPPASLKVLSPGEAIALAAREAAILQADMDSYAERQAGTARQLAARKDEIAALQGRLDASARQTEQINSEIVDARDLVDRGLAPISRLNALIREADSQQSNVLQTKVLLNQAFQAVAQLELDQANAPRERVSSLTARISETRATIASLSLAIRAATDLIEQGEGQQLSGPGKGNTLFQVKRADGSAPIDTNDGSLPVFSGDLVTVLRRAGVNGSTP